MLNLGRARVAGWKLIDAQWPSRGRMLGIPTPDGPALTGALLVLAMTVGYALPDQVIATRARQPPRDHVTS
jgi:hypothetical protein